ncbi:cobalamin biosynthesis protein CobW [Kaistia algarum]|uniref:CobW family GTP-binding protein n=1 Tax=Kaistia algarum TaxID=2083279 RepID=UPI000CE86A99|nr:GTP-binding protein [Kaistia algarum]MCX5515467.1 GTP-binding protein [Kaistia algarum]PPE78476.1 cobalamin biosynthesis protein CobW [Kaistia algarum]
MSEGADLIPVDVLTGFLGSGKTSLIRRLLESGRLRDTAILVNEFASLPLDQRLIALSGGNAAVVGNGCICCAVDGSVRDALLNLATSRAAGTIPAFSRVLVETSGIADPAGLVATLALDRMLKPRFRPGRVVTLVDLSQGAEAIADTEEALSQIVCADLVLLTKADLASEGTAASLLPRITAINPLARILLDDGSLDPFDPDAFPVVPGARGARTFSASPSQERHATIRSGVLRLPGPVDWSAFATWLSLLAHRHGGKLLRLKGTLTLAGEIGRGPVLVQSVRHIVHRPEHLPPGSAPDDLELVVILRDLDPARLQRSLAAFLASTRTAPPAAMTTA